MAFWTDLRPDPARRRDYITCTESDPAPSPTNWDGRANDAPDTNPTPSGAAALRMPLHVREEPKQSEWTDMIAQMEEWLAELAQLVSLGIEAMAVLVIAIGTLRAVYKGARAIWMSSVASDARVIWLQLSHMLIVGLSFQLASDIVRSAVSPDWDAIGRLAAIAVIRGGLSLLLEAETRRIASPDPSARTGLVPSEGTPATE